MELNQCNSQVKILPIQLSLILEVLNFPFHLMYSKRSEENGPQLSQTLIAPQTKLSATSRIAVKMLPQNYNQWVSR
jgi:hypothetical protein